jgi:hypothetical protein
VFAQGARGDYNAGCEGIRLVQAGYDD